MAAPCGSRGLDASPGSPCPRCGSPVPAVVPAPTRGRPCLSGRGLPLSEAGPNHHFSPLNALLAAFYVKFSLQQQIHLVDVGPQVSSNSLAPHSRGSRPWTFAWLGGAGPRPVPLLMAVPLGGSRDPGGCLIRAPTGL